jgi:hypothetical protein
MSTSRRALANNGVFCAAAFLGLAVLGCATQYPVARNEGPPMSPKATASDLRPGVCCRIEMIVPLTASDDSYRSFTGEVSEVTPEEIVLADALEESCVDYQNSLIRPPVEKKDRGVVRVPLAGVASIGILDTPDRKPAPAANP